MAEAGARASRRGGRLFSAVALLGLAGVVAAPRALDAWAEAKCERLSLAREPKAALAACTGAFERTATPAAAAWIAMANVQLRQVDEALAWADRPEVRELPRARRVRGYLLMVKGEREAGLAEYERGLADALASGDVGEAGRMAHALAGLHWSAGRYSAAFDSAELAEARAREAGDGATVAFALLAKADIFRHLGDAQRAEAAYAEAVAASEPWPSPNAFALLKQGMFLKERGMYGQARAPLERALALAEQTENGWVLAPATNYVAQLRLREGDVPGARTLLERASVTVREHVDGVLAAGMIARAEGRHRQALADIERAEPLMRTPSEKLDIAMDRAELHLELGEEAAAVAAWREAMETAEALSGAEPVHQGWVVARRRAPFDRLFVHLVERGRHAEAWEVLVRYTRAEALSQVAEDEDVPLRERLEAAERMKAAWKASAVATGREVAVPRRLPGGALLVVHEVAERFFVGVEDGAGVRFSEVGPAADSARAVHAFRGDPSDGAAAAALGEALWRSAGLEASDEPLLVAPTGRLRGLAFGALRAEGRYWAELRPVARLAHLDAGEREARRWSAEARVVGDPEGDLPSAREEALWVAERLGTTAAVGSAATCERVLGTKDVSVLHLASHAEVGLGGVKLRLAKCAVSSPEVLAREPRARLVVLASCASTMGREAAGSDSLATAFLRAGSEAVLATTRSVPDAAAGRMVRAFYRHGGADDPVRALARAQAELAPDLPVSVWSAFAVILRPDYSP